MNFKYFIITFAFAWSSLSHAMYADYSNNNLGELITGDIFLIMNPLMKAGGQAETLSKLLSYPISPETVLVEVWITSSDSDNWEAHGHPKLKDTYKLRRLPATWFAIPGTFEQKPDGSIIRFSFEDKNIIVRLLQDGYRYRGLSCNLDWHAKALGKYVLNGTLK